MKTTLIVNQIVKLAGMKLIKRKINTQQMTARNRHPGMKTTMIISLLGLIMVSISLMSLAKAATMIRRKIHLIRDLTILATITKGMMIPSRIIPTTTRRGKPRSLKKKLKM